MFQPVEDVRSAVVDIIKEATGIGAVFLEPPDLDPDDLGFGDHVVVLMQDKPEAEGLVTVAHVLEFSIWFRLKHPAPGQARPDFARESVALTGSVAALLQEKYRWDGLAYLPRVGDPFAEAEVGSAGEEWDEAMLGWQCRVSMMACTDA